MKQYCRYCTNFCTGNGNWCEAKHIEPSDVYAKRPNRCKEFDFNEMDAYDIARVYKPRKEKPKEVCMENLCLWEEKDAVT